MHRHYPMARQGTATTANVLTKWWRAMQNAMNGRKRRTRACTLYCRTRVRRELEYTCTSIAIHSSGTQLLEYVPGHQFYVHSKIATVSCMSAATMFNTGMIDDSVRTQRSRFRCSRPDKSDKRRGLQVSQRLSRR